MPRATIETIVVSLVVSLVSVLSPTAARAQTGTLSVAIPAVPANLDPASALDGPVGFIARQVFDTLVRYVEGGSDVEPALATQWSVSRDGLMWSFRLREGVRFHDGTVLTAQHVVDSLDRLVRPGHPLAPQGNPAAPVLIRGTPGVIREIKAVDARTVSISLLLPYAPLVAVLAHPVFSVTLPATSGAPSGVPYQGTGAFAITETAPGRIVLDARPGHWAAGPRVARVVITEIANETQALADLDNGSLDVLLPASAPSRQAGAVSVPSWRVGFLALQTERDPFNRVKVRRASAIALDAGQIARALGPAAVPLQTFLPPGVWARRDATVALDGNTDRAKRLIAEAGARRGGASAVLVAAEGAAPGDVARLVEAIRSALAAADLPVAAQVQPLDAALLHMRSGEPAASLWEARVEAGDPHFLLYPLSTTEGAVRGAQATNFSRYRNPRLDDLLIRASQLSFRPERLRLYMRAQAMLAEEMPWIPLYVRLHWAVARRDVRNFRLHPSGNHRLDQVSVDAR